MLLEDLDLHARHCGATRAAEADHLTVGRLCSGPGPPSVLLVPHPLCADSRVTAVARLAQGANLGRAPSVAVRLPRATRAFLRAIAAWSAKVWTRAICASLNGCGFAGVR